MVNISFIVFKDDEGYYRLEGEGDMQTRVDMTEEEASEQIERLYNQSMLPC